MDIFENYDINALSLKDTSSFRGYLSIELSETIAVMTITGNVQINFVDKVHCFIAVNSVVLSYHCAHKG